MDFVPGIILVCCRLMPVRVTNGEMLGVPVIDHVLDAKNQVDYLVPRSTFDQLVQFILTDCDSALKYLPDRYLTIRDYNHDEVLR